VIIKASVPFLSLLGVYVRLSPFIVVTLTKKEIDLVELLLKKID